MFADQTDLCISNAVVKTGIGFSAGVVLSVLLFRRKLHAQQALLQLSVSRSSFHITPFASQDEHSLSGSVPVSVSALHTPTASAPSTPSPFPVFVSSLRLPPPTSPQPARHRRPPLKRSNKRLVRHSLPPRTRQLTVSKRHRTRAPTSLKRQNKRVSRHSTQPRPRLTRSRKRCAEFRYLVPSLATHASSIHFDTVIEIRVKYIYNLPKITQSGGSAAKDCAATKLFRTSKASAHSSERGIQRRLRRRLAAGHASFRLLWL